MMFRTVLGNATNNLLPEYTKEPIQSRIQCLVESRAITPAMGDWANVVRLAGNEVVHEAEAEFSEAEAQQLEAFTRLFLEYAFTLPSQVAEWHKRRADGADDVPDAPESDRERARVDTPRATARPPLVQTSPETDREALVALYNATGGPYWDSTDNWLTDVPIGEWSGVTTDDNGRVTGLYFYANQLSGEIPPGLGNLTNLKELDLSRNQLSGEIPPELGNLANLTGLALSENELSGEIPPELGGLANLQELVLSYNELSGGILPELGNLPNLTYLGLDGNELSGQIPPELGNLANLTGLALVDNQLSGEIPPELGNLTNLTRLLLYGNQLSGEIPPELGNLPNLTYLGLSGNELSGQIPPELGGLPNLTQLDLSRNQLSGEIPPELGSLASLSLSGNQLSG